MIFSNVSYFIWRGFFFKFLFSIKCDVSSIETVNVLFEAYLCVYVAYAMV